MRCPEGQEVRLGDQVVLWAGCEGVVVCSIDTGEFSDDYPEADCAHLERGVLIASSEGG
jgi:hypothetical protein